MNNEEKRLYRRYPIKVLKTLRFKNNNKSYEIDGFIENISLGGCNFISTDSIPDNVSEVFFEIRYENNNMPLILEVVRRREVIFFKKDCYEYGLKFTEDLDINMIKNMKFI
ncbi:MAG: PilZ domain-containing protein [Fusobacteria bacterium]|nr:PilZ domain-containing protein [Fusobacteriota bacterium]